MPTSSTAGAHVWSVTQGMKPEIQRPLFRHAPKTPLPAELEALAQVHEAPEFTLFLVKDFHPYMRDPRVEALRDLASRLRLRSRVTSAAQPFINLPIELEKDISVMEFPMPEIEDIEKQLDIVINSMKDSPQVNVELAPEDRELIVKSAQGLTTDEIESALARSLVEAKKLTVDQIIEEKKQIVRKTGTLQFYPAESKMGDVGGHELLKDWLGKRSRSFTHAARELGSAPQGRPHDRRSGMRKVVVRQGHRRKLEPSNAEDGRRPHFWQPGWAE